MVAHDAGNHAFFILRTFQIHVWTRLNRGKRGDIVTRLAVRRVSTKVLVKVHLCIAWTGRMKFRVLLQIKDM